MTRGDIRIFEDCELMSQYAAELFVRLACSAIAERGRFSVALSGGSTPLRMYELLAQPPLRHQLDWEHVHVFWGDERFVPESDERNNANVARHKLLNHVPIPQAQIHPIGCTGDIQKNANEYESLLRTHFGDDGSTFDLALLGLGTDGHTASLFPDTNSVCETERWVNEVILPEKPDRITLTATVLNRARTIAFLVSGSRKASLVHQVIDGKLQPWQLPAQLICPEHGDLVWILDRAASTKLNTIR